MPVASSFADATTGLEPPAAMIDHSTSGLIASNTTPAPSMIGRSPRIAPSSFVARA
jgi:hypothetical protein